MNNFYPLGRDWRTAYLFLCGLLSVVKIRFIGDIFGSDIALFIGIPLCFAFGLKPPKSSILSLTFILLLLWLCFAFITDLIRLTPPEDFLRGWAKIVLFGTSICSVYLLSSLDLRRLSIFFVGIAAGTLLRAIFYPDPFQIFAPWKFGFGGPVTILVIALLSIRFDKNPLTITLGVLLTLAAFSMTQNSRSLAGLTIIGAVFAAIARIRTAPGRRPMSARSAILYAAVFFIFASGILQGYSIAAGSGLLGDVARQKYLSQSAAGMGLILGGRSEGLVSTKAIQDSPLIGHGSWAKNMDYVAELALLLRERGFKEAGNWEKNALIPSHSHLLGAWIEAGLAGGLFWFWVFGLTLTALLALLESKTPTSLLGAYLFLSFAWAIWFSPFSGDVRFFAAGVVCFAVATIRHARTVPLQFRTTRPSGTRRRSDRALGS